MADSPHGAPGAHHSSLHRDHAADMRAAFTGLIVGIIALGAVLFTIVRLTNAKYAHEQPAAAATH